VVKMLGLGREFSSSKKILHIKPMSFRGRTIS